MTKKITILTNYNNKLQCGSFIHIDLAPTQGIPESVLENTEVELHTRDNSHPPVKARLMDICRLELHQLHSLATWQSHGMDHLKFREWITQQNPSLTIASKMCIYYYQKIDNE